MKNRSENRWFFFCYIIIVMDWIKSIFKILCEKNFLLKLKIEKQKKNISVSQIHLEIESVKISFDKNCNIFSKKLLDLKVVFCASNWLATFTNSKQKHLNVQLTSWQLTCTSARHELELNYIKQNVFQIYFVGSYFLKPRSVTPLIVLEHRKMVSIDKDSV